MKLRAAQPEDLSAIMNIERSSFIPPIQETEQVFLTRITVCKNCFIIFSDEQTGTPAGYFSAERWRAIPETAAGYSLNHDAEKAHDQSGPVLYLSSFALLPQYRGSGLGKQLFSESLGWFSAHNRGLTDAVLVVNEMWRGAAYIYTSAGFTELFRLPGFFPTDDGRTSDAVVMVKKI